MVAPRKTNRPFAWLGDIFSGKKGSLNISEIRALREQHRHRGGRFVVYFRSASFIWFKHLSAKLVWVAPETSPKLRGLRLSLSSLLLGWWSFEGMINTLLTLAHNCLGGFDLTQRVLDPTTQDGWLDWETDDRDRAFQKKRFLVFIGMLIPTFLFVLPMLGILVITLLDKWLR